LPWPPKSLWNPRKSLRYLQHRWLFSYRIPLRRQRQKVLARNYEPTIKNNHVEEIIQTLGLDCARKKYYKINIISYDGLRVVSGVSASVKTVWLEEEEKGRYEWYGGNPQDMPRAIRGSYTNWKNRGGEDVYKGAGCVVRIVYLTPGACLSTANNKTVAPVLITERGW